VVRKRFPAAAWIIVAMILGIIVGYMIFISYPDKKVATQIAGYISLFSDMFLRLIKMLIAPLVFSTLVVGIAHMGDASSVGRVFGKALGWFVTASLVSLVLGLISRTCCSRARTSACRCPTSAPRPTWRRPSSR
jgi:Na+/H+-dicarboxylate symporter